MAYSDKLWKEAKKKCRLTMDDLSRAKRLDVNPRSLIKNIPNKNQPWRAPVSIWLRDIEEKQIRKMKRKQRQKERSKRKSL